MASSYRAVKAVWVDFAALFAHFDKQSSNLQLDSKERSTFSGLKKTLCGFTFIKNLAIMCDALEELAHLSESLQQASISLPKAHRLITREIEILKSRKETGGDYYREACEAIEKGIFHGVQVVMETGRKPEINMAQFYQGLVDSMSARLLPETERSLVSALATVFPSTWPPELSAEYGEQELKLVCHKFRVPYNGKLRECYRDFKDTRGGIPEKALKNLVNIVSTLPVSTAECERAFSKMNIICTSLRSTITISHLSSLMLISIVGPPLPNFDCLPYVRSWLAQGRRDANSTAGPSRKLAVRVTNELALWSLL